MTNKNIYDLYKGHFPEYAANTAKWYPIGNGKHGLRACLTNGQEVVFTYADDSAWCLETLKSYKEKAKGAKRM